MRRLHGTAILAECPATRADGLPESRCGCPRGGLWGVRQRGGLVTAIQRRACLALRQGGPWRSSTAKAPNFANV
jgi:hypothetical protein